MLLEVKEVSKRFGRIQALKDVSFSVKEGELVCIVAHTNAGKSTLLKIIAGVLKPDRGEVYIEGKLMNDVPPWKRPIGYMPQTYALFPHKTVLENVMFGPLHRGKSREEAKKIALRYIEMVGLKGWEDAYPHQLSGGMQQRVALARALAVEPKLLLLDEPLSALDAMLRVRLRSDMRKMFKEMGTTVLWVTHDQEEAMSIADRLVVMRKGRVVAVGRPADLYYRPPTLYVAHFLGEINFFEEVAYNGYVTILGQKIETDKEGPVVVGVRPEDIIIGDEGVKAKIKDIRFLGGYYRIVLETNGFEIISYTIEKPKSDVVRVKIREGSAVVFDYPPEGIARAIQLE